MKNLGEKTLSECEDKEDRASIEYWEKRVKEEGTHGSIFLTTPSLVVDNFTERHKSILPSHVLNKSVLEIGCGYGRMLDSFVGCRSYIGIDFVAPLIDEAKELAKGNPKFKYECMSFRDLSPETFNYKFDIIVGIAVITSVEFEFPKVLKILKSVLKDDGYILWLEEEWYRIDFKENWREEDEDEDVSDICKK
jgi:SAM-dependent methyltransferase